MKMTAAGHEQFSRIITNGIARCERSGQPFMTSFLTPAQQALARTLCRQSDHAFLGGRSQAIRARLIVGVDAESLDEETQKDYVHVLRSSYRNDQRQLKHSDVLGALIHAGIDREAIGDIAVDEQTIYLVCLPGVSGFIVDSLRQIGRTAVLFEQADSSDMPPAVFEPLKVNTASMRSDCIVAALAHCSRTRAKEMISQGFVKVNDEVLESVRTLCNNDTISVRRVGKFRIGELDGVSRKGRLIVHIEKYQ